MPFNIYVLFEMTHVDLKAKIYCIYIYLILFHIFCKCFINLWYERIYIEVLHSATERLYHILILFCTICIPSIYFVKLQFDKSNITALNLCF